MSLSYRNQYIDLQNIVVIHLTSYNFTLCSTYNFLLSPKNYKSIQPKARRSTDHKFKIRYFECESQRRIQNPVKNSRYSFLRWQLIAVSYFPREAHLAAWQGYRYVSQNGSLKSKIKQDNCKSNLFLDAWFLNIQ